MADNQKIVLDNGLIVYVGRRELKGVYGHIGILSGSASEPAKKRGIVHFLEHASLNGNRNFASLDAVCEEAESIGINPNANTSFLSVTYPFSTAAVHAYRALALFADCAFTPKLTDETVEKEREIVLHELNGCESLVSYHQQKLFNEVFFRGTPNSEMVLGRRPHIQSMTQEDIRAYHAEHFVPGNAEVALFGKVTNKDLNAMLETLNRYPARKVPPRFVLALPALHASERVEREHPALQQAQGTVVFRAPKMKDELEHTALVVEEILDGKGDSGLFKNIRERQRLAYSVNTHMFSDEHVGYLSMNFGCNPDKVDTCVETCLALAKRLNPSEDEMERARSRLTTRIAVSKDALNTAFGQFIQKEKFGVDAKDYQRRVLATTRKDVRTFAERYLSGLYQAMVLKPAQ